MSKVVIPIDRAGPRQLLEGEEKGFHFKENEESLGSSFARLGSLSAVQDAGLSIVVKQRSITMRNAGKESKVCCARKAMIRS